MKPFFIEIPNFWAWVDKFWSIFGQTIRTHFSTVPCPWDWDLKLGRKELGGGLPINRLIGLSRSFSIIGLGFGHLIFWTKYLA